MVQIHAQHRVAGLAQRHIHGVVGLGAGMRLHVGKFRAEQLAGPLDGQVLRNIHALAAAVIALAGVALRILIGQYRACCGQHRLRHDIFRGDQLNVVALALIFGTYSSPHLRITLLHKIHVLQNHRKTPPFNLLWYV